MQSFCIAAYIVGTEVSTKFSGRSFSRPISSELLIAAPPKNNVIGAREQDFVSKRRNV